MMSCWRTAGTSSFEFLWSRLHVHGCLMTALYSALIVEDVSYQSHCHGRPRWEIFLWWLMGRQLLREIPWSRRYLHQSIVRRSSMNCTVCRNSQQTKVLTHSQLSLISQIKLCMKGHIPRIVWVAKEHSKVLNDACKNIGDWSSSLNDACSLSWIMTRSFAHWESHTALWENSQERRMVWHRFHQTCHIRQRVHRRVLFSPRIQKCWLACALFSVYYHSTNSIQDFLSFGHSSFWYASFSCEISLSRLPPTERNGKVEVEGTVEALFSRNWYTISVKLIF
jgi:hypothetical protein